MHRSNCCRIKLVAHRTPPYAVRCVFAFAGSVSSHFSPCECSTDLTLMQPFLLGTGVTTLEEYQDLLRQVEMEVDTDDFSAVMFLLTAWGEKPQDA